MTHKLTAFILRHPPDENGGSKEKSAEKKPAAVGKGAEVDLDEIQTPGEDNGDEDEDWSVDVSAEAVKRRMADLSDGVKNLAVDDDLDKTEKERVDIFYNFVKQKKDKGTLGGSAVDKEIFNEAERLEIKDKAALVLSEVLFDSAILQQLKQHRMVFLRVCHQNPKAQKYLLGGIEHIVTQHKDTLLPKVSILLKAFYDTDILEEEVILEWGKKPSKKYTTKEMSEAIREKAQPFLTWLKEAEDETSSEEESDEDEVEIAYDDRASGSKLKVAEEKKPAVAVNNGEAGDDDFDIDAI
jgi:translation initiation factor 5